MSTKGSLFYWADDERTLHVYHDMGIHTDEGYYLEVRTDVNHKENHAEIEGEVRIRIPKELAALFMRMREEENG